MRTAVVITTYNNPRLLGICLKSLTLQTEKNFDIFIADDGSTDETRQKITSFHGRLPGLLEHVWHEDKGYRKSEINNLAFKRLSAYDVVICIDHDVLLNRHFVEDHVGQHRYQKNLLFMGRRVDLGPDLSAQISEDNVSSFNDGINRALLRSQFQEDSKNVFRAVRLTPIWLQRLLKRDQVHDLLGSNFSISRELLFRVNGFNEELKSYWGEDGDLFIRARNSGAVIRGSKSIAIQLHVWHKRLEPTKEHVEHYQKLLESRDYKRCSKGIFKDAPIGTVPRTE